MGVILVLSPHLDDAVFSCPGRIMHEVENGNRVVVATVFSHGESGYAERRAEDEAAVRQLGAEARWLGLLDAPSRSPFYDGFQRIIFDSAPADAAPELESLCQELQPTIIYCPLAVGGHVDHRLTFDAVTCLSSRWPRCFYEERPYSWVRHAVALRLSQLGFLAPVPEREFLASFRAARYVRRYLPPGPERLLCEARLRFMLRCAVAPAAVTRWTSTLLPLRAAWHRRVLESLSCYRSQLPDFIGSAGNFTAANRRHSIRIGAVGLPVERFWTP